LAFALLPLPRTALPIIPFYLPPSFATTLHIPIAPTLPRDDARAHCTVHLCITALLPAASRCVLRACRMLPLVPSVPSPAVTSVCLCCAYLLYALLLTAAFYHRRCWTPYRYHLDALRNNIWAFMRAVGQADQTTHARTWHARHARRLVSLYEDGCGVAALTHTLSRTPLRAPICTAHAARAAGAGAPLRHTWQRLAPAILQHRAYRAALSCHLRRTVARALR